MSKINVAILYGGRSVEHAVSVNSAKNIFEFYFCINDSFLIICCKGILFFGYMSVVGFDLHPLS